MRTGYVYELFVRIQSVFNRREWAPALTPNSFHASVRPTPRASQLRQPAAVTSAEESAGAAPRAQSAVRSVVTGTGPGASYRSTGTGKSGSPRTGGCTPNPAWR